MEIIKTLQHAILRKEEKPVDELLSLDLDFVTKEIVHTLLGYYTDVMYFNENLTAHEIDYIKRIDTLDVAPLANWQKEIATIGVYSSLNFHEDKPEFWLQKDTHYTKELLQYIEDIHENKIEMEQIKNVITSHNKNAQYTVQDFLLLSIICYVYFNKQINWLDIEKIKTIYMV